MPVRPLVPPAPERAPCLPARTRAPADEERQLGLAHPHRTPAAPGQRTRAPVDEQRQLAPPAPARQYTPLKATLLARTRAPVDEEHQLRLAALVVGGGQEALLVALLKARVLIGGIQNWLLIALAWRWTGRKPCRWQSGGRFVQAPQPTGWAPAAGKPCALPSASPAHLHLAVQLVGRAAGRAAAPPHLKGNHVLRHGGTKHRAAVCEWQACSARCRRT